MNFFPDSEKTRKRIVETTAAIFNKKGYAGTAITDLTEATKLTKGGIYGNFKNKEDIALAAFDYNLAWIEKKIKDRSDSYTTSREKLMANIEIYLNNNTEIDALGGCPMQNTGIDADDTHEGLREKAASGLMNWKNRVAALLTAGIESKEFREDIDVQKTALSLIALIEGALLIGRVTRDKSKQYAILDTARELVRAL